MVHEAVALGYPDARLGEAIALIVRPERREQEERIREELEREQEEQEQENGGFGQTLDEIGQGIRDQIDRWTNGN